MRFIVKTSRTEAVIEADSLDAAVEKANVKYSRWIDVRYANYENAKPTHEVN